MLRGFVALSALAMATAALAAEAPNAAHTIAQKFAAPTESPPSAPVTPSAATAEAPKPALKKSIAASTERPPLDYEMEMLRRARAEQAAPAKAANSKDAAPKLAAPELATPVPPATTSPAAAAAKTPAAPVTKAAEVAPPAAAAPKVEVQAKTDPTSVPPTPAKANGQVNQATVLLALETGGASSKSGTTPTFDPMICMADVCFISAGLSADAVKLSKLDALKLKTTSDASPDSCKNKVACVFRNVAVPSGAQVQVVELGSASHDPSRASDAQLDTTCKMTSGDLNCDNPIASPDFRIWVVPEETAKSAGVQAIEEAVADGLPHEDVARSTDK